MSGFVYIWYDKKHKRYYIGCHWGSEDDGYVCSSTWMNLGYQKRPQDFKRRILGRYHDRNEMYDAEHYWLQMINEEEMKPLSKKPKYYNLKNKRFNHWTNDEKRRVEVQQTIKERMADPEVREKHLNNIPRGYTLSEERKNAISEKLSGRKLTEEHKANIANNLALKDPNRKDEIVAKIQESRKGYKHSEETKAKHYNGKNNPFYGRKHSEETKAKMREAKARRKLESSIT